MKIALGLFHFNPHWGADGRMGRRHCAEALGPLLRALRSHPSWRVDIEVSGSGLESIDKTYPEQLRLLRLLVEMGQVELISSMYTPNLWIGFPRRDLLRSIELNRRCITRLGFNWTRIFFAQEAFFGMGVGALREYFDVAICKDDYLSQQVPLSGTSACFTLSGMKVVVASNHLLNELASSLLGDPDFRARHSLSEAHVQHLVKVSELSDKRNFPACVGSSGTMEWLWYHCGDGNHISTIYKPDDWQRCYYDSTWMSLCLSQLNSYERNGYQLSHISDLVANIDYSTAAELPPLIEGSWNPKGADGVFCWMGRNSSPWEDDAGLLTAIARARARLVAAERVVNNISVSTSVKAMKEKIEQGWIFLLNAQISDTLGWYASGPAVGYALRAADQVLLIADQVIEEAVGTRERGREPLDEEQLPEEQSELDPNDCPTPEVFGGEGTGSLTRVNRSVWLYEVVFKPSVSYVGVRFRFAMEEIVFCPTGLEEQPVRVPLIGLQTERPTLPLANGLLQIASDLFLIKHTLFVHVSARIDHKSRIAEFAIDGARDQVDYRWRFFFVRGTVEYAVTVANLVNCV